jgi:hypothetical protein
MIRTTDERCFTREDIQILSLFAAQVAPAVVAKPYRTDDLKQGVNMLLTG